MLSYLDRLEEGSKTQVLHFDYTHFLCKPREMDWSFQTFVIDKLAQFLSRSPTSSLTPCSNESFAQKVCRSLSCICSDVANLTTLINEARKEKVRELNITLPYALDELELSTLREMTRVDISQFQTDREFLKVKLY